MYYANSVLLRQPSNVSAILQREEVNSQWDDDEARFVLDPHTQLDLHSASSLKQQSVGRHVAPLGHIIIMPSQPVFALSPECCVLSEEATNPRSTALEASTLTATPQMRLSFLDIYIIILYICYFLYYKNRWQCNLCLYSISCDLVSTNQILRMISD